jgi:hypothetical protein
MRNRKGKPPVSWRPAWKKGRDYLDRDSGASSIGETYSFAARRLAKQLLPSAIAYRLRGYRLSLVNKCWYSSSPITTIDLTGGERLG